MLVPAPVLGAAACTCESAAAVGTTSSASASTEHTQQTTCCTMAGGLPRIALTSSRSLGDRYCKASDASATAACVVLDCCVALFARASAASARVSAASAPATSAAARATSGSGSTSSSIIKWASRCAARTAGSEPSKTLALTQSSVWLWLLYEPLNTTREHTPTIFSNPYSHMNP